MSQLNSKSMLVENTEDARRRDQTPQPQNPRGNNPEVVRPTTKSRQFGPAQGHQESGALHLQVLHRA